MRKETREYIKSVLKERALYAEERGWFIEKRKMWSMHAEFKRHLATYDLYRWLIYKMLIVAFGLGVVFGYMLSR